MSALLDRVLIAQRPRCFEPAAPAPRPAAIVTDEQAAGMDDTAEVMTRGQLAFWPTSEGEHIVAVAPDGRVRQVGGLWK